MWTPVNECISFQGKEHNEEPDADLHVSAYYQQAALAGEEILSLPSDDSHCHPITVIAMLGQLLLVRKPTSSILKLLQQLTIFLSILIKILIIKKMKIHGYQIIHDPDHHAIDMYISLYRYIDI